MKAVVITGAGGPEVLQLRDVPQPEPAAEHVLVRVHAAGVNRADLLQRQGRYPAPPGVPPDIPGLEYAGEVAALGANASLWKPGQHVFGLVAGGAYAEYIVAHERTLVEIPERFDWTTAAAVPEVFTTAHDAMLQASLRSAEQVLITAVGSGVGVAAVQLARALGAIPFGTSRTADKIGAPASTASKMVSPPPIHRSFPNGPSATAASTSSSTWSAVPTSRRRSTPCARKAASSSSARRPGTRSTSASPP